MSNLLTWQQPLAIFHFIYIYLHNWCIVSIAIRDNLIAVVKSNVKLWLTAQSDCWLGIWGGAFWEYSSPLVAVDCFRKNLHLQLCLDSDAPVEATFKKFLIFFLIMKFSVIQCKLVVITIEKSTVSNELNKNK